MSYKSFSVIVSESYGLITSDINSKLGFKSLFSKYIINLIKSV